MIRRLELKYGVVTGLEIALSIILTVAIFYMFGLCIMGAIMYG
jgi:hypothetical protein